jgi:hypothetical protein
LDLRVSVATLDRVVFPHPQDGTTLLALERKASLLRQPRHAAHVCAQPFGGGVRILNPKPLQSLVGPLHFDSDRSRSEQDFRLLIPASAWEQVKHFCLQHLANPQDADLEADPHRELVEEFAEVLDLHLEREQYTCRSGGFVIEDDPVPTTNAYAQGQPTVRIYRIFEVQLIDDRLCAAMLKGSQQFSDQDLGRLALEDLQKGGKGRANAILTLPLNRVRTAYLDIPPEMRYRAITVAGHRLDESVLAILEDVEVPQYQRLITSAG